MSEAPRPGRRPLLTPEVQNKIVAALNAGNYLETAAAHAGVTVGAVHSWLARGRAARDLVDVDGSNRCPTCRREGDTPCVTGSGNVASRPHAGRPRRTDASPGDESRYIEFVSVVEKARAAAEVQAVALIRQAAMGGTWQAAAWYLERSAPTRWGRQQVQHVGAGGGPIEVTVEQLESKLSAMMDRELEALIDEETGA